MFEDNPYMPVAAGLPVEIVKSTALHLLAESGLKYETLDAMLADADKLSEWLRKEKE
jgi:hypothetical protein